MLEDLKNAIAWLSAAVSGILLWIARREIDRIDRLERKQQEFVTRKEFDQKLNQWSEERRQMHLENKDTLRRIHERVDALWERGSN